MFEKNKTFTEVDVWLGRKDKLEVYLKKDVFKTIPKARKRYLKAVIKFNGPVKAPVLKDDVIGKLKIFYKDDIIEEHDFFANETIKKLNIFARIFSSINYLIWGDV